MYNNYVENGVIIRPNVIAEGDNVIVNYKGVLFNDGAHSIYMHLGFGEHWEQVEDIKMERGLNGFEATIPITRHKKLNVAFKDCANNWDNNSGKNYSFEVEAR